MFVFEKKVRETHLGGGEGEKCSSKPYETILHTKGDEKTKSLSYSLSLFRNKKQDSIFFFAKIITHTYKARKIHISAGA